MQRIALDVVPDEVRRGIEAQLGSRIVGWANRPAGYGPALAAECALADGRAVFVKAVSPTQNPDSPELQRVELIVGRQLPESVPAPRLMATHDDGQWVAAAWELVVGRQPGGPWTDADLDAVFAALRVLPTLLDPSPVTGVHAWVDACPRGWLLLARQPPPDLDPWALRHLDRLVEIEASWPEAVEGTALVHSDVRADNLVVDPADRVWFTDWANARIGAPWIDVVSIFPAMALEGGPDPESGLERAGRLHGDPDPDAVTTYLVALAGYFTERARLPSPPGLPTVRAFQAAQGEISRRWIARRLRLR